jgi:pentatricopeptide repeat protein
MRFEFVTKSFRYLSVAEPTYHPDHQLLRQGLVACDILMDSDLAWDLIRRAITNYSPSQLHIASSPLLLKPHVPFRDFVTGITICLKVNNMKACENILKISKKMDVTSTNIRSLYVLVLKGYAHAGDTENAFKILETMNDEKLNPG